VKSLQHYTESTIRQHFLEQHYPLTRLLTMVKAET